MPDTPASARPTLHDLEDHGAFARRHIGPTESDQAAMLASLGYTSRAALIDAVIPPAIRSRDGMGLGPARGEEEALDGFEFLSMAEAGELCHWEIVEQMATTIGAADVKELAGWAVGIQREHVETVRRAALQLAAEEVQDAAGA